MKSFYLHAGMIFAFQTTDNGDGQLPVCLLPALNFVANTKKIYGIFSPSTASEKFLIIVLEKSHRLTKRHQVPHHK